MGIAYLIPPVVLLTLLIVVVVWLNVPYWRHRKRLTAGQRTKGDADAAADLSIW